MALTPKIFRNIAILFKDYSDPSSENPSADFANIKSSYFDTNEKIDFEQGFGYIGATIYYPYISYNIAAPSPGSTIKYINENGIFEEKALQSSGTSHILTSFLTTDPHYIDFTVDMSNFYGDITKVTFSNPCAWLDTSFLSSQPVDQLYIQNGFYEKIDLSGVPDITVLNLAGNLTNKSLELDFSLVPDIEVIDIYSELGNTYNFETYFPNMIDYNIYYSKQTVVDFSTNCPDLERFTINDFQNLQSIDASDLVLLTNANIQTCPNLESVDLSGCTELTTFNGQYLNSSKLSSLDLSGCLKMSSFKLKLDESSTENIEISFPAYVQSSSSYKIISFYLENIKGALTLSDFYANNTQTNASLYFTNCDLTTYSHSCPVGKLTHYTSFEDCSEITSAYFEGENSATSGYFSRGCSFENCESFTSLEVKSHSSYPTSSYLQPSVSVYNCENFTTLTYSGVVQNMSLEGCSSLSSFTWKAKSYIKNLNLLETGVTSISIDAEGLSGATLTARKNILRTLKMQEISDITTSGILNFANVGTLQISECPLVTSLSSVFSTMTDLQFFHIGNCGVTSYDLSATKISYFILENSTINSFTESISNGLYSFSLLNCDVNFDFDNSDMTNQANFILSGSTLQDVYITTNSNIIYLEQKLDGCTIDTLTLEDLNYFSGSKDLPIKNTTISTLELVNSYFTDMEFENCTIGAVSVTGTTIRGIFDFKNCEIDLGFIDDLTIPSLSSLIATNCGLVTANLPTSTVTYYDCYLEDNDILYLPSGWKASRLVIDNNPIIELDFSTWDTFYTISAKNCTDLVSVDFSYPSGTRTGVWATGIDFSGCTSLEGEIDISSSRCKTINFESTKITSLNCGEATDETIYSVVFFDINIKNCAFLEEFIFKNSYYGFLSGGILTRYSDNNIFNFMPGYQLSGFGWLELDTVGCTSLKKIDITNSDVYNIKNCSSLFLEEIRAENSLLTRESIDSLLELCVQGDKDDGVFICKGKSCGYPSYPDGIYNSVFLKLKNWEVDINSNYTDLEILEEMTDGSILSKEDLEGFVGSIDDVEFKAVVQQVIDSF